MISRYIPMAVICGALALSACAGTEAKLNGAIATVGANVAAANAALAKLANGKVATACKTIAVAEGYYNAVSFLVPPTYQTAEQAAAAVVNTICGNPPADISTVLLDLSQAWAVIQAATTVPAK